MLPVLWGALLELAEERNWESFEQLTVEQAARYGDEILGTIREDFVGGSGMIIQGSEGFPEFSGVETLRLAGGAVEQLPGGEVQYTPSYGGLEISDYTSSAIFTGWSGPPSAQILIFKTGKLVTVKFYVSGTSNGQTAQFSLPYQSAVGTGSIAPCFVANNGIALSSPGKAFVPGGSAYCKVDKALNTTDGWTSSGLKIVQGWVSYATD